MTKSRPVLPCLLKKIMRSGRDYEWTTYEEQALAMFRELLEPMVELVLTCEKIKRCYLDIDQGRADLAVLEMPLS